MSHILIGLIVGFVMGLTGAGGALISIPLFLTLQSISIKEATTLSLIAVLFGTATNLFKDFGRIDYKISILFAAAGTFANILAASLKPYLSDILVVVLLSIMALYSIWSIWQKDKRVEKVTSREPSHLVKIILTGFLLGLITTFTGLGGGILLMPILINIFGRTYNTALPTSLATIFLISLSSLLVQGKIVLTLITIEEISLLGLGAFISFLLLRLILSRFDSDKVLKMRKIIFTLVTIYSISGVIMKSL